MFWATVCSLQTVLLYRYCLLLHHTSKDDCTQLSSMRLSSCRFAVLLLILLAMAAIASAQPDSNGGDDPMDISWVDNDLWAAAFANNELSQMVSGPHHLNGRGPCADKIKTSNPLQAYVDPSQLSHPFVDDGRSADSAPNAAADFRSPSPAGYGGSGSAQTYAAAAQRGMALQRPERAPPLAQQPATQVSVRRQQVQQRQQVHQQQAPTQAPSQFSSAPSAGSFRMPVRTKTYADAVRSPPEQQQWPIYGDPAAFGYSDEWPMQSQQQLLPNDITSNPNFHLGVTERAETLQGWSSQPRTLRDRLLPRLNTNSLSPYASSTHRSPASITSPSSSRMSNRRTKQQILSGIHKYRCRTCHAGFDTKPDLKHHMRSHVPEGERRYECDACHKRFNYPKDLNRHALIHLPKTLFCPVSSCKASTKGFRRQDHLDRHVQSQHPVDSAMQSSRPASSFGA